MEAPDRPPLTPEERARILAELDAEWAARLACLNEPGARERAERFMDEPPPPGILGKAGEGL